MPKNNNLKDFLTDLYEGIKIKNPNASRNPQDFRQDIENIISGEEYEGEYTVIPSVVEKELETKDKLLIDNVKVTQIPFSKVANSSGGNTVTIGVAPTDINGETILLKL